MTPELITMIVRAVVTFAVIGGWLYLVITGQPVEPMSAVVIALIAFWFGESLIAAKYRGKGG